MVHGQRLVRKISLNAGAIESRTPALHRIRLPPLPRDIFRADITDKFNFGPRMDEFSVHIVQNILIFQPLEPVGAIDRFFRIWSLSSFHDR